MLKNELKTVEAFNEAIQGDQVVVLFTADWCPDCFVIKPFISEVEAAYDQFTFYMVNRDQLMDVCVEHDVFGIPSFIAFHQGKETGRFVSKDRKTRAEIEAFLNGLA